MTNYKRKFKLNEYYSINFYGKGMFQQNPVECLFIKTTKKGFNFLKPNGKVFFNKQMSPIGYKGKDIKHKETEFYFFLPSYIVTKEL